MALTTGLTTTHHSAVNLPSGTSVTVRVQAVNTAGTSTSNSVVLQGLYICIAGLHIQLQIALHMIFHALVHFPLKWKLIVDFI